MRSLWLVPLIVAAGGGVAHAASTVTSDGTTVTLIGGPEDNHISTGGGLFGTMITDTAGIVAGPGCSQSSDPTQASCGQYTTINADLGAGSDVLGTAMGPGVMGTVHGGPGDDTVYGDAGNSVIFGDDGNDVLYGGAGNDTIDGGAGIDQIYGDGFYLEPGDGNDTITSRDGTVDEVQCGLGIDTVTADSLDRIGSECDVVDRGAPPTPTPKLPSPDPVTALRRVGPYGSSARTRTVAVTLGARTRIRITVARRFWGGWRTAGSDTVTFTAGVRRYTIRGMPRGVFRITVRGLTAAGAWGGPHSVTFAVTR